MEILLNVWGMLFLMLVVFISLSVLIFSYAYMSLVSVKNFVLLYFSFIFSMLWLVLSNNFYWMMLGWDGLGVVSFLLIVFYMNHESINNGLFTLFQNRIGDLFFVFFMIGFSSLIISNSLVLSFGLLFLIIGSVVKSAQFPFNAWLLSAMSAPTPISSLVHSSTLVVAGVYILLQFSYCMSDMLEVLKFISMLTLFLSTFGLLNESDMKKLIAYSTMSHVSLMMYMYSFKLYKIVYFHLNIHAMFKSLMFMCFGFLMLISYHAQDKRLVTLVSMSPIIKIIYYFSCFCLMGLPFLSGFFSKDLMIEKIMTNSLELTYVFFLLMFLAVSIYYGLKLMMLTNFNYSYVMVEKNIFSLWSLLLMVSAMIFMINIYLSLVFSLTLEYFSFKIVVYFMMLMFMFLSIFTNLNYKMFVYEKYQSFQEIWKMHVFQLDSYVYWNMMILVNYLSLISGLKMVLLMNWWVVIGVVMIF